MVTMNGEDSRVIHQAVKMIEGACMESEKDTGVFIVTDFHAFKEGVAMLKRIMDG